MDRGLWFLCSFSSVSWGYSFWFGLFLCSAVLVYVRVSLRGGGLCFMFALTGMVWVVIVALILLLLLGRRLFCLRWVGWLLPAFSLGLCVWYLFCPRV